MCLELWSPRYLHSSCNFHTPRNLCNLLRVTENLKLLGKRYIWAYVKNTEYTNIGGALLSVFRVNSACARENWPVPIPLWIRKVIVSSSFMECEVEFFHHASKIKTDDKLRSLFCNYNASSPDFFLYFIWFFSQLQSITNSLFNKMRRFEVRLPPS